MSRTLKDLTVPLDVAIDLIEVPADRLTSYEGQVYKGFISRRHLMREIFGQNASAGGFAHDYEGGPRYS